MMFSKSLLLLALSLFSFIGCSDSKASKEIKKVAMRQDIPKSAQTILIIGSGPAGMTAGIYASRAQFNTIIVEGNTPGGLLTTTPQVENWPGEVTISGMELMNKLKAHAQHEGVQFLADVVTKVDFSKKPYVIETMMGKTFTPDAVIIATGAAHKHIGCPGEKEYAGRGVSYCATCDAPFFKNKHVVVVGGGNTALVEAHHLSRFAKEVTIVHTSPQFHVNDPIKQTVEKTDNITIVHNSYVKKIDGNGDAVTGVELENKLDKRRTTIKTDGVFVAIGFSPNTALFKDQVAVDKFGYIASKKGSTATNISGVFSAGDVSHFKYKQGIVAAGDGCRAALDAIYFLDTSK